MRLTNNIQTLEWVAFTVSAGSWWCVVDHQVWLLRLFLKLDMFGRDEGGIGQCQPAPAPQSNAPSKGRQFLVDDVVVLEFLLQLLDIVNLHNQAQTFAGEQEEGIVQGLGGFAAEVCFLSFAVLLHILVGQALDLLVCELHTDDLFVLASRHKDGQLLTFGGMSLAGVTRLTIPVGSAVSGVASSSCMTSFKASCSCAVAMSIYGFLDFNDSLYIGQQGLQLPDNPSHGVRHGIQSQGVAVEKHVAKIVLNRGFDDFVLRLKGLGAQLVQKLSKHSELV